MLAVLAPVAYGFGPATRLDYDVTVNFNGFLPLLGGNEGKVEVKMGVGVTGLEPKDTNQRATSEIKQFEVSFNGAKLPLTVDNVTDYFPKTTIDLAPTGKILKTDAPDRSLPVRLPGLDVKHFPDITYVPIELPPDGLDVGTAWQFQRDFGGAPITYDCRAESQEGDSWKIHVDVKQAYTVLENSVYEVVKDKADAESEVTTTMAGSGVVVFDSKEGRVSSADMKNIALSDFRNISTGEKTQRKLETVYAIKLKTAPTQARKQPRAETGEWWDRAVSWGSQAVQSGRGFLAWVQTASLFGLKALPGEFQRWLSPVLPLVKKWAPWLS